MLALQDICSQHLIPKASSSLKSTCLAPGRLPLASTQNHEIGRKHRVMIVTVESKRCDVFLPLEILDDVISPSRATVPGSGGHCDCEAPSCNGSDQGESPPAVSRPRLSLAQQSTASNSLPLSSVEKTFVRLGSLHKVLIICWPTSEMSV